MDIIQEALKRWECVRRYGKKLLWMLPHKVDKSRRVRRSNIKFPQQTVMKGKTSMAFKAMIVMLEKETRKTMAD